MIEDEIQISIVVPVYNTEFFLNQCIESILSQDVLDMEILVINDCSTDGSLGVLKSLAKSDPRLRIISLDKNIGLGPARNLGVREAVGKWICFLDSDDIMQPFSLKKLIDYADTHDSQIVIGGVLRQIDNSSGGYTEKAYKTTEALPLPIANTNLNYFSALINIMPCWAQIFQRNFLLKHNIFFQRKFQEDHDFGLHAILESEKVSIRTDIPFVRYRNYDRSRYGDRIPITKQPWGLERTSMMVDHLERVLALLHDNRYLAKYHNLEDLRRTRLSYYLGIFVNTVLPSFLAENELKNKQVDILLSILQDLIGKMRLHFDGIDSCVESLRDFEDLVNAKYYELVSELIALGKWELVKDLVVDGFISAQSAAEIGSSERYRSDFKNTLQTFIVEGPKSVRLLGGGEGKIVPPHIRKVFLHIGMSKTGSTALQNFLLKNHNLLLQNGIIFPKTGIYRDTRKTALRTAGHQKILTAIRNHDHTVLEQFYTEISMFPDAHSMILTAENMFHHLDNKNHIKALRKVLGGVDCKVVVYIRRQDSWLESMYAEAISGGHFKETRSFEEWVQIQLENGYLHYDKILDKWRTIFGSKNLIVRQYGQTDVIQDFCDVISLGATDNFEQIEKKEANLSTLSNDGLETLRAFNRLPFYSKSDGYQTFVHEFIRFWEQNNLREDSNWFSEDIRVNLRLQLKNMNEQLMKKYSLTPDFFWLDDLETEEDKPIKESEKYYYQLLRRTMELYVIHAEAGKIINNNPKNLQFKTDSVQAALEQGKGYNWGVFRWRRCLVPMVRLFVKRIGNQYDLIHFDKDPIGYMLGLRSRYYVLARRLLFPQ